jgi:TonB family protein
VLPNGSTADIEVVQAEPFGLFEANAIRALQQWQYEPAIRDGQPRGCAATLPSWSETTSARDSLARGPYR